MSVRVVDQGDRFGGLLRAVVEIDVSIFFVREGEVVAIVLALRGRGNDGFGGGSGELWPVIELNVDLPPFAWSIFSQQVIADSDGVFGRFRWVNLGRVGDRSHDWVYNCCVECDLNTYMYIYIYII